MEKMLISGVAADKNVARISLVGLKDEPGVAFRLFDLLARNNVNVDMILQSIGRNGTKDITFTVESDSVRETVAVLEKSKGRLGFESLSCMENVAKVSIVGAGMATNPGVAAKMFEALYNVGINIKMISTSEIRVTVLLNADEAEPAMRAIHDAFKLGK